MHLIDENVGLLIMLCKYFYRFRIQV